MARRGSATNNNATGTTSLTINTSGIGILQGDLLIGIIDWGTPNDVITVPSGWSAITGLSQINPGNEDTMNIAYKVAGASEPSSYTWTSGTSDYNVGQVIAYSGRNTASPFTATARTANSGFTASSPYTPTITTLTSAANDDVLICLGAQIYQGGTVPTYSTPSGYGNGVLLLASVSFSPILITTDNQNVSAGSSPSTGGTITLASATNLGMCAFALSMAVAPIAPSLFYHRTNRLYFI